MKNSSTDLISTDKKDVEAKGSIIIDSVSKRFRKNTRVKKSYSTLKSSLINLIFRKKAPEGQYIQALKDVSIHIPPGAALGIIGRNGSGKSSLLKLIAGIYQTDSGRVSVNGKVSALIELGAGFHPDFTGRENVYLGGVMFGLTKKEIDQLFPSIVAYAELEDFIDNPVKTYSSGMYMRLGFSLAVHTDPDILLIDEVLAVGDAGFINRCHDTISEFKRRGKTLIVVTHDLESVSRWCDEAIWLENGVVKKRGEPRPVIDSYLEDVDDDEKQRLKNTNAEDIARRKAHESDTRWGNRDVEITSVRMLGQDCEATWVHHRGDKVVVEVEYKINRVVSELEFGVGLLRADGLCIHGTNTEIEKLYAPLPSCEEEPGVQLSSPLRGSFVYTISDLSLVDGSYFLDIAVHDKEGLPYDYHHRRYKFSVRSHEKFAGVFTPDHSWKFEPRYEVLPEDAAEQLRVRGGVR